MAVICCALFRGSDPLATAGLFILFVLCGYLWQNLVCMRATRNSATKMRNKKLRINNLVYSFACAFDCTSYTIKGIIF